MTQENEKKFNEVIRLISEEGLSLREACNKTQMNRSSFHNIVNEDKEKLDQYTHAREEREEYLFDEMLKIADDGTKDTITKVGHGGQEYEAENTEWVNRSKLRIETRKWALSKMNSKKFGNKVEADVNVDGAIKINLNLGDDE